MHHTRIKRQINWMEKVIVMLMNVIMQRPSVQMIQNQKISWKMKKKIRWKENNGGKSVNSYWHREYVCKLDCYMEFYKKKNIENFLFINLAPMPIWSTSHYVHLFICLWHRGRFWSNDNLFILASDDTIFVSSSYSIIDAKKKKKTL